MKLANVHRDAETNACQVNGEQVQQVSGNALLLELVHQTAVSHSVEGNSYVFAPGRDASCQGYRGRTLKEGGEAMKWSGFSGHQTASETAIGFPLGKLLFPDDPLRYLY